MNYERILIRYGEISTKGRNRNRFIDKLKSNIINSLKDYPQVRVQGTRDRMFLMLNGAPSEAVCSKLSKIFGIQSFSPTIKVDKNLNDIRDAALSLVNKLYLPGKTFKVSARRADKTFELDTHELNHEVGGFILKNVEGIKVDVKNPDINLIVEIRKEGAYLSSEVIQGTGGMPVGSSGKSMLMLSGGIDSPVAGYLSMKRGVEIEAVHFYSPPFTSERAKQKVLDLSEKLAAFSGSVKVHVVPFTEIQQTIHQQVPENYTMTSTRRLMLRLAEELRKKNEGFAIITGESLGQVASQTLESMLAINEVTSTPVLRPLISMDKLEIIDIAKDIDTHEISNLPYEDCCTIFTPASPKTKPKLEKVQYYESFVDFAPLIEKAIDGTETIVVKPKGNADAHEELKDLF
ncbi:tRNA uracil 4-sulfurtransferase ThiI [Falsibacillus albus]|uniref:Probable tRNA sulfurtransferase n=1 Tax=Falsibacillus albus TaxID=2478915 RepID=A0A3L7K4I0_9BACI|nr:tRNA uracil 4-sulfurtransferase ThiI [Falsibacillus albus]RLQ97928.1 tRNA 4-thiouridine(8) synthase ThiI [Falsibacillus albus]